MTSQGKLVKLFLIAPSRCAHWQNVANLGSTFHDSDGWIDSTQHSIFSPPPAGQLICSAYLLKQLATFCRDNDANFWVASETR